MMNLLEIYEQLLDSPILLSPVLYFVSFVYVLFLYFFSYLILTM